MDVLRFKILNGGLYVKGDRHPKAQELWHSDVGERVRMVTMTTGTHLSEDQSEGIDDV